MVIPSLVNAFIKLAAPMPRIGELHQRSLWSLASQTIDSMQSYKANYPFISNISIVRSRFTT